MTAIAMLGWALGTWLAAYGLVLAIAHRDLRWVLLLPVGMLVAWMT